MGELSMSPADGPLVVDALPDQPGSTTGAFEGTQAPG
jgi:hypothetical protein